MRRSAVARCCSFGGHAVGWAKARDSWALHKPRARRRAVPTRADAHNSFTKLSGYFTHITAPIQRQDAAIDVTMEAAVRPVAHARHMPMLHGVEMDVIHMALKIGVIPNGMLPEPTLPQRAFASGDLAARRERVSSKATRESTLDQAPAQRIVRVSVRQ